MVLSKYIIGFLLVGSEVLWYDQRFAPPAFYSDTIIFLLAEAVRLTQFYVLEKVKDT